MGKFVVSGITQVETIVRVNKVPIEYAPLTTEVNSIYTGLGGDAYNESLALRWLGDEVEFKEGGIIRQRAAKVLDDAHKLLEDMVNEGLFEALEKGIFADIKRSKTGGKGLAGVVTKGENYFNPFIPLMKGQK